MYEIIPEDEKTIQDSEKEILPDEIKRLADITQEMLTSDLNKDIDVYDGFYGKRAKFFEQLRKKYGNSISDHKLFHAIIFSSFENRKSWLDFSQNEIDNNSKIKEFVEIDLEIKKFIEDEYEKHLKTNSVTS